MSKKVSWRSGYVVMAVLFIALLVAYLDRVNITILIADKTFLNDMGLADRPDLRGMLMSVFLWTYGLASLLLAFSMDKIGARRGLVIIALVWALAMFLGGFAWSFAVLIMSRIVLGMGESVQLPINAMVVKNWAPPRERGIANSIWGTGIFLGTAVSMPLVAKIIASMGWRGSFFVLGVVSIVVVVPLVLLFIYNRPKDSRWVSKDELDYIETELEAEKALHQNKPQGSIEKAQSEWKKLLKNPDYWLTVTAYSLFSWLLFGFMAWIPSYLKMERGFTWAQMGNLSSLPYFSGAVFLIISGFLMFKVQRNTIFMWTGTFTIAICMTLAVMSKNNFVSALWLSGAMGGVGWSFGASYVVLQKIIPAQIMARAAGLNQGTAQITAGFVPYIMGLLIAANNGSFFAGLTFLIIVALLNTVLCLILYSREGRTFGKTIVKPELDEKVVV